MRLIYAEHGFVRGFFCGLEPALIPIGALGAAVAVPLLEQYLRDLGRCAGGLVPVYGVTGDMKLARLVARGWAAAVRPLLLDLCRHTRHGAWLRRARAASRDYVELAVDTEAACVTRFEFTVHAYFREGVFATFHADASRSAPPLIEQLVRFGLHGVSGRAPGCAAAPRPSAERPEPG